MQNTHQQQESEDCVESPETKTKYPLLNEGRPNVGERKDLPMIPNIEVYWSYTVEKCDGLDLNN